MATNSNYHRGRIFQNRAELRVLVEEELLQQLKNRMQESNLHVSQSGLFNLLLQWLIHYDVDLKTLIMNCDEFLERAKAANISMTRPQIDTLLFDGELLGSKFNKRYMLLRQSAEPWLVEHAVAPYIEQESIQPLEHYLTA